MGEVHCFLGEPNINQAASQDWSSYLFTPEFLYFHSVLMGLQLANIGFFLATVYYLADHWRRDSALVTSNNSKVNFMIVFKLFFIMGIPWLGEFFSHMITHWLGHGNSFAIRVTLDILPLFSVTNRTFTYFPFNITRRDFWSSLCWCSRRRP
jgi:hypothetical protein